MFERFTDRARRIMALANQEAQRFNHEYIGPEHILLGLVIEGTGVGANVLKNFEVNLGKVRDEIEKLIQIGPTLVTMGKLPQTSQAQKVIEYAIYEARGLNHNYVGSEHLLLGVLRTPGIAADVLSTLGVRHEEARDKVLNILGQPAPPVLPSTDTYSEMQNPGVKPLTSALGHVIHSLRMPSNHSAPATTGDLLLTLFRTQGSIAQRVLDRLGVTEPDLIKWTSAIKDEHPEN